MSPSDCCQALAETRRKVIVAGEEARLERDVDLKAIDEAWSSLDHAEARQVQRQFFIYLCDGETRFLSNPVIPWTQITSVGVTLESGVLAQGQHSTFIITYC